MSLLNVDCSTTRKYPDTDRCGSEHGILGTQENLEIAVKRLQRLVPSPERLERGLGISILYSSPDDPKVQPDDLTGLVPQSQPFSCHHTWRPSPDTGWCHDHTRHDSSQPPVVTATVSSPLEKAHPCTRKLAALWLVRYFNYILFICILISHCLLAIHLSQMTPLSIYWGHQSRWEVCFIFNSAHSDVRHASTMSRGHPMASFLTGSGSKASRLRSILQAGFSGVTRFWDSHKWKEK